ncbi:MAG TPA: GNAT family N-acetyltransferase [Phycisphaerae bacterium]|nr:GNAT family N-acetyltransferase [Phycisphaerae bacterium]
MRRPGRRAFEYVLFRSPEVVRAPEMGEVAVERVGPGRALSAEQTVFLRRCMRLRSLLYMMRWQRRGTGWVYFGRIGREVCHSAFVTPARRYRRIFPVIEGDQALLIGPCFTDPDYRGRGIYPRILRHIVTELGGRGYGPFYVHTSPANAASLRGIEKAGFLRLGWWSGRRWLLNAWVSTRRVGD